jgi:uncharacterized protein (PEP-CTERM system associated)
MAITDKIPRLAPVALALLAVAPQCHAGWRLTPFIGLTETWTDNVALQPDELARSQWVTEAAPGLSLVGHSPRVSVAAMAKWHYFAYSGPRQANTANQQTQYNANLQARVVDDWLYMDAAASGGTQSVSAFGPQVTGNLWATGNRAEVDTWRISPYLRHRFGGSANLTVRYARDSVDAGKNLFGSSTATSAMANLASGSSWQTLGWSLDYSRQDLDNKLAGPSSSENAQGTLRYKLTRTFALTASSGYDRFDFQSLGGRMEGSNWSGGFIWAPSARTKIEASAGHRYFGPSGALAASHRTRHSVWIASYSDAITTSRAQFLLPAAIDTASMLDKLFLASFPDPVARQQAVQSYMLSAGLPQTLADSINYFSNRYMRQKQLQAALGLNGAHGSWMLTAYDTQREALSVEQSDSQLLGSQLAALNANTRQLGISSIYTYRMSSRTAALLTATASRSESLTTGLVQDARVVRLGVTHQMPDRMQLAFEVRHASGGAGALTTRSYTENAVSATFSIQL